MRNFLHITPSARDEVRKVDPPRLERRERGPFH